MNVKDSPFDALVIDDYYVSEAWLETAARYRPTFVVDDWMRRRISVTGLVNPNLHASRKDYPDSRAEYWQLGSEYALVRKEIRNARSGLAPDGTPRHVLVTLGGSDPEGVTALVADDLTSLAWYLDGGHVCVVLGSSYAGAEPWREWPAWKTDRLEVVRRPKDFVRRCATADLVVCGASTTTYELAHLGRPFLPLGIVQNQARIATEWAAIGVGRGTCIWHNEWRDELRTDIGLVLASSDVRARLISASGGLVDGRGVERMLATLAEAADSHHQRVPLS